MEKYKNKVLFCILLMLLVISTIININKLSTIPASTNNKLLTALFSVIIQAAIAIAVVYIEIFVVFLIVKIFFKKTYRLNQFFYPVVIGNIICVCINIVTFYFFKEINIDTLKIVTLVSPVTVIKVLIISYMIYRQFGFEKKKMLPLGGIFILYEYLMAVLGFIVIG